MSAYEGFDIVNEPCIWMCMYILYLILRLTFNAKLLSLIREKFINIWDFLSLHDLISNKGTQYC